jgi:hypothetical protein
MPTGIPFYVDPDALTDTDTTMASTIKIYLEGIPLRTTLRLALHQLGLDYQVEGGVLLITEERFTFRPGPMMMQGAGARPGMFNPDRSKTQVDESTGRPIETKSLVPKGGLR